MAGSRSQLEFPSLFGKSVSCCFDGGEITSDSGVLLVGAADRRTGVTKSLSDAITDLRCARRVRHSLHSLVMSRVYAISQGYEDANDLDDLGSDPAFKTACGSLPRTGPDLASQPTISRLENSVRRADLVRGGEALARCVIRQLPEDSQMITIDVDATDDPCHGQQEFEFFHGFYDGHCYVPLLIYVTGSDGRQRLLGALLRHGKAHAATGIRWVLRHAVRLIRERFAEAQIIVRGDSGFGGNKVLRLCDALGVKYLLGIARNSRLQVLSTATQIAACVKFTQLSRGRVLPIEGCREFGELEYKAGSWDKKRRVIVKAEITRRELNPRYIVTNLDGEPEELYTHYCHRGESENRIKEFKLDLASGRTSCHRFLANQFRLLLHLSASILLCALQDAVAGTRWAKAQAGTLRLRLLKLGARVVESVRRVKFSLASSFPDEDVWERVHALLTT